MIVYLEQNHSKSYDKFIDIATIKGQKLLVCVDDLKNDKEIVTSAVRHALKDTSAELKIK